jgi:hypothetical protein
MLKTIQFLRLGVMFVVGVISFLLLVSQTAFAQGAQPPVALDEIQENLLPPPSLPVDGDVNTPDIVSCFDYYNFGSVQVDVSPYTSDYSNADPILFGGQIINQNPYPVVNGQVYMKIFKLEQEDDDLLKENGYPMIDFVLVEDGVNIPANGNVPLQFEWEVPYQAGAGEYQAAFFFTTEHRYNLLGYSFTDNVTGNTATFNVSREDSYQPIVFNKNTVHLNDTDYNFAVSSHFVATEQVVAYATLVNDTDEHRTVDIVWDAYKWDGIQEANKRDSETQRVDIPANGEVEVSYLTPVLDTSVTFIEVKATDGDSTSVLHIRYVRDGVGETRINYPSLYSYPLKAGEETTIFSCVHSTNEPVVSDSTLTLTLADKKGNIIHSYTYEGDITGAMMGVKDIFTPDRDLVNVSLTAKLTQGGETVEEVTINYNCADLDPTLCALEKEDIATDTGSSNDNTDRANIVIIVVLILLLIVGGAYLYIRNKDDCDDGDESEEDAITSGNK